MGFLESPYKAIDTDLNGVKWGIKEHRKRLEDVGPLEHIVKTHADGTATVEAEVKLYTPGFDTTITRDQMSDSDKRLYDALGIAAIISAGLVAFGVGIIGGAALIEGLSLEGVV